MKYLSWVSIFRLGAVQLCLGAIVVICTSTLNRLMVVEQSLPAILPGLLVGLHYAVQMSRPTWGYKSDTGGNRTRFIILGMAVLGLGGFLAAFGFTTMESNFAAGLAISILAYTMIGAGVGASGTSLLALLATQTHPRRRAAAATITWLMMIFGIAVTATVVGKSLDPYSPALLLKLVGMVGLIALTITTLAVWGVERGHTAAPQPKPLPFAQGLAQIWDEPRARSFTIFIFLSMVAYFMQELILEPYAGLAFGFTPGQSTQLSGAQNGGVFVGMLTVGIAATGLRIGSLRAWVMAGCAGSALALLMIAMAGQMASGAAIIQPATMVLGFFNGMFAVAAIGSMMALAGEGRQDREGTRMGLWGAAQAMAAGLGGVLGAGAVDLARHVVATPTAFGLVFTVEAGLFVVASLMAAYTIEGRQTAPLAKLVPGE